jgi:hypothetical protein
MCSGLLSRRAKVNFFPIARAGHGSYVKIRKNRNCQNLIDLFRRHGKVAQAFLAQQSGLQASTVSNLIKMLRGLGLVVPEGKGNTTPEGGRPSEVLVLNPNFQYGNKWPETRNSTQPETRNSAHDVLYYNQVRHGLRTASVLVLAGTWEPLHLGGAFSNGNALWQGEHQRAGSLDLTGLEPLSSAFWPEMKRVIGNAAGLLDPEYVGLGGDLFAHAPPAFFTELENRLAPVILLPPPPHDAAATGRAWMHQDNYLEGLFHAESESP